MEVRNIEQLRNFLADNISNIGGTMSPAEAESVSNMAGKIISTCNLQIKYAEMRNESPEIGFMNNM